MSSRIEYEQLCGTCARDRYLEFIHCGQCDLCHETRLVGLTRQVAEKILMHTYD